MRLQNTSRYPTEEVRQLVEFAARGVTLARVAVHVKNHTSGCFGRAYSSVPSISPRSRQETVDRLVVLRIPPPARYPVNNLITKQRWLPWGTTRAEAEATAERLLGDLLFETWYPPAMLRSRIHLIPAELRNDSEVTRYGLLLAQPYGGRGSPLIEVNDWREMIVYIAAHEARHIHQFRHKKRLSEVDCERFAAKALDRFRAA